MWQKAIRDNPNPSRCAVRIVVLYSIYAFARLVPVLAVGFEDLKKRVQAQKSQAEAQLAGMQVI
jgi:Nucleoporin complex subunit 54